jgi:hypothetical protein
MMLETSTVVKGTATLRGPKVPSNKLEGIILDLSREV